MNSQDLKTLLTSQGQTLFLEKEPDLFTRMVFTGGRAAPPDSSTPLYISILVNLRVGTMTREKFPAEKSYKLEFILKSRLKIFWHFFKLLGSYEI